MPLIDIPLTVSIHSYSRCGDYYTLHTFIQANTYILGVASELQQDKQGDG